MNHIACKVYILIFFHLLSLKLYAQIEHNNKIYDNSAPTVLSIYLTGKKQIIFNTADGPIKFKNPSSADSTITRHIYIEKPTHLFYNNVIVKVTGDEYESGNLLLQPGDSIVLGDDGHTIATSTGFSHFADSFLTVPLFDFPFAHQNLLQILDSAGLQSVLANARNNYLANEKRITEMSVEANQKRILRTFNYILQARQVCAIPFDRVKNTEKALLDSTYTDLLLHTTTLDSMNSGYCNWIYNQIIRYSAFRRGIITNDFWLYFDKADPNITSQAFYLPYLIACLQNTYKNIPDQMAAIVSRQKNRTHYNDAVDTVYALASILLQTKSNYKTAKSKLDEFANGKYAFLLSEEDELHREQRTLQTLAPVNVIDFDDKKIRFQALLKDSTANITVLDFWASWCVPCIADYKYLKKVKAALSKQSIRFISISIDTEEDKDAWIKRTKDLHTFHTPDQYRLEDPKNSPVNEFFNLYSIPRYIVIDKQGKILEEDFTRPYEPAFQRKLENYLRTYQ